MKFIDFFSGIGGFREGLTRNGFIPVGWCEKDKFAQKAYEIIHNPQGEWFSADITAVRPEELPEAELYCGGFPCQSFSIAGKRGGFKDTRGTLFFEIMRLAKARKPKYLLLENVKGLLSHNRGKTFGTILRTLWECGYNAQWQVLNSKDFGVPQNRERVYIVGHLRGQSRPKVFPIRGESKSALKQIINGRSQGYQCYNINGIGCTLTSQTGGLGRNTGLYACASPDILNKKQNGRRFKENGEPMFTLTGQDRHGVAIYQTPRGNNKGGFHKIAPTVSSNSYEHNNHLCKDYKIRRLTPLECFRLQGFPDKWYYKLREHISDSQMYKLAGNAVTVNVIEETGRRLKWEMC